MSRTDIRPGSDPRSTRAVLGGAVAAVLIILCYVGVDRPAATWTHAMFAAGGAGHGLLPGFIALTHLIDPLPPLAVFGFIVGGAALVTAPHLRILRTIFVACAATLIAIAVKDQLKFAFGRLWPETWVNNNPSWILNGAYGFAPFHGGAGWFSFPSGHMTVVTAPLVVLMLAKPAWRAWAIVPILLVAIGLYGADYHFVSDMIAGVLVGSACAGIVWHVMAP